MWPWITPEYDSLSHLYKHCVLHWTLLEIASIVEQIYCDFVFMILQKYTKSDCLNKVSPDV